MLFNATFVYSKNNNDNFHEGIEILFFKIPPGVPLAKLVKKDKEFWNQFLLNQDAFEYKYYALSPEKPDELILLLKWSSFKKWKKIPPKVVKKIEDERDKSLGIKLQLIKSYSLEAMPGIKKLEKKAC